MRAAIVGISGMELTAGEAALLRARPPAGVILFGRNIGDRGQLESLTAALRDLLPAGAVIMVDQEGGRVARLRPPHWRAHPAAAAIGRVFERRGNVGVRAAWLHGALIGLECATAGFSMVAAPVLDLAVAGTHAVIGDRALSASPEAVAALGRAMAFGLLAAGVVPVAKHVPGHGRALVDSHLSLPVVEGADLVDDMLPFMRNSELPAMMTAHILYPSLDPVLPATLSPAIISRVIRGRIGFRGLLISDDLAMEALSGTPAERALGCLAAGCDIALYCPGDAEGTRAVLEAVPELGLDAAVRLADALALARSRRWRLDADRLDDERGNLLT